MPQHSLPGCGLPLQAGVKNMSVRALERQSTKGTVDGEIRLIFNEGEVQY